MEPTCLRLSLVQKPVWINQCDEPLAVQQSYSSALAFAQHSEAMGRHRQAGEAQLLCFVDTHLRFYEILIHTDLTTASTPTLSFHLRFRES